MGSSQPYPGLWGSHGAGDGGSVRREGWWRDGGGAGGRAARTDPRRPAGADAQVPRETLRFHAEAKGAQVLLDPTRSTASRLATFHDGIVFSQRPVRPGERVALRVLGHEGGWCGGLRVGFTRLNPARVRAPSLPPFVCPDLELQSPTWAAVLPDSCARLGDVVRFWVNRRGRLCARVNAGPRLRLRKGVPTGAPLWAVMDVYGTTKAIELLLGKIIHRNHALPLGHSFTFIHIQSESPSTPASVRYEDGSWGKAQTQEEQPVPKNDKITPQTSVKGLITVHKGRHFGWGFAV